MLIIYKLLILLQISIGDGELATGKSETGKLALYASL